MPRESEFTPPNEECPHPELWAAPDGQSTETEVSWLVKAFVKALKPEYVVETGSAYGHTSALIGHALWANRRGRLVSLEVDPRLAEFARRQSAPWKDWVEIRQQSSMEFEPEQPIDFAWFDSLTHLRVPEFRRFYPWMHHRTVVGFHDTGPQHPTRPWIQQLIDEGLLQAIFLPTPRGVCFGRVLK